MSDLKKKHSKRVQYYTWNTFFCKCILLCFIIFFSQAMFFSVNIFADNLNKNKTQSTGTVAEERSKHLVFNTNKNKTSPIPIATDERLRRFVYSPNEVFSLTFQAGYRSVIELQKDEKLDIIVLGDSAPWDIKALGQRLLFIKPLMPNVRTNMTIYTDKRRYMFEISSTDGYYDSDEPVAYIINFFYPDINVDIPPSATTMTTISLNKMASVNDATIKKFPRANGNTIADAGEINTSYTYSTKGNVKYILPTMVFDDGERTYFRFNNSEVLPTISVLNDDYKEEPLPVGKSGEYVYIETTAKRLTLRGNGSLVCVFNEKKTKRAKMAYINK